MISLAGCKTEQYQKNEQYVSEVRRLVNDSVSYTRKLHKHDNDFDFKNSENVRGYLLTADDLINTLEQIQKLQSTDEFDKMNTSLKEAAEKAMEQVSQLRAMVVYSQENKNDSIYSREKEHYFKEYDEQYDIMVDLSSEIQTYWRNA